ncbi:hypothetical protein HCX50_16105 [Microbacterium oxydans]|uniref:VG15 protein n=1 Tax=Microbacterium sp. B19(2022) TaxID=2914045 RepID=UPI0014301815|nr:hypothetical protein [Microbacterium sp. B19(2022)]NJI60952.1 hypothetical protein [Microbacterium sp. B19(2022)]
MTTRADVTRLSTAQRRLVTLAQNELTGYFATFDLTRPEAVRDALLEIVPLLVREYGALASIAAAEWYEQIRPGSGFNARLAPPVAAEVVQGSTRALAGVLFTDDPAAVLGGLAGAVQRHITYSGRTTIALNSMRDPLRPRFGRVPSGARTCAWCAMLASRGFTYATRVTAGEIDHFHDDCDCQIVSLFDADAAHIEGYDPRQLFDRYAQALAAADSGDPKVIAAYMRRMFPDEFTDGVHEHDI